MSRRATLFVIVLVAMTAIFTTALARPAAAARLRGVLWIGGFAHDFDATAGVLVPALAEQIELQVVHDGSFLDAADADRLDVILMYHCFKSVDGVLTPAQQKKLLERIRGGLGVVAIHASYYSFLEWDDVHELYGARFIKHGSSEAVLVVRTVDENHPLMKGLDQSFEVMSELYQSTPLADDCHVLARTREKGTTDEYPSVWTRRYGKGRVVTILPGHWPDAFRVAGFQKLIAASVRWTANQTDSTK